MFGGVVIHSEPAELQLPLYGHSLTCYGLVGSSALCSYWLIPAFRRTELLPSARLKQVGCIYCKKFPRICIPGNIKVVVFMLEM